tara:strand:+ start:29 stop:442 length:414 start_codon:yes stop_codon:yes gene_type:complete
LKYQQGDVLFIKSNEEVEYDNNKDNSYVRLGQYSKANKNDDPVDNKTTVALGEVTGHSHTFYENDNADVVVNTYGFLPSIQGLGKVPMYVEVKAKPDKFAIIKHEEHKPLSLPPGLYKTRIVREFDHLSQQTRNVVD